MGVQAWLSIITLILLGAITIYMYLHRKHSRPDLPVQEKLTQSRILTMVKREMADMLKEETFFGKDDVEWEALYKRTQRIRKAAEKCVFGIDADKVVIKDLIKSIIQEIVVNEENMKDVIDFNSTYLDPMIKFEVLMYYLKKKYGKDALTYLIKTYHLDSVHYDIEDGNTPSYMITDEDIDFVYSQEIKEDIPFNIQLEIEATLIYQKYKGLGCIDTLDEMHIDGYNIGTSGSILSDVFDKDRKVTKATRSVWIYFEGKYIHAKFFTFYTMEECRRIVQLLARYNRPGPLTKSRGYVVTTKWNKSRVLALCPDASEYWACFVRNFSLSSQTLESLVDPVIKDPITGKPVYKEEPMTDEEIAGGEPLWEFSGKEYDAENHVWLIPKRKYKNAIVPKKTIELLMKGQVTTGFTGRQGSGKTTMMTAAISPVDARFNIRVLELAPELYLRELYPDRNILSVQETATVTAAELQDALKKSDAALTIVGEVAQDIIAARMLQLGQVATIFTIFSHHANRTEDLVNSLTNSVVASSGGAATPATVLPQVIDVIKMDVHLDYDVDGNRFIERITEIRRLDSKPYPDREEGEPIEEYRVRLEKEYYTRVTDRRMFEAVDILHFDKMTFTYVTDEFFSEELTRHILNRLPKEDIPEFKKFALENWGAA